MILLPFAFAITGLRPIFPCPSPALNRRVMYSYLAGFSNDRLETWAFGDGDVA